MCSAACISVPRLPSSVTSISEPSGDPDACHLPAPGTQQVRSKRAAPRECVKQTSTGSSQAPGAQSSHAGALRGRRDSTERQLYRTRGKSTVSNLPYTCRMAPRKKRPFDAQAFLECVGVGKRILTFAAGAVIFSQGDPSDSVMYVRTGTMRLSVLSHQ